MARTRSLQKTSVFSEFVFIGQEQDELYKKGQKLGEKKTEFAGCNSHCERKLISCKNTPIGSFKVSLEVVAIGCPVPLLDVVDSRELVKLIDILNPENKPGRITIITRMQAENMIMKLPHLIRADHRRYHDVHAIDEWWTVQLLRIRHFLFIFGFSPGVMNAMQTNIQKLIFMSVQVRISFIEPDWEVVPEICRQALKDWDEAVVSLGDELMSNLCEGLGVKSDKLKCLEGRMCPHKHEVVPTRSKLQFTNFLIATFISDVPTQTGSGPNVLHEKSMRVCSVTREHFYGEDTALEAMHLANFKSVHGLYPCSSLPTVESDTETDYPCKSVGHVCDKVRVLDFAHGVVRFHDNFSYCSHGISEGRGTTHESMHDAAGVSKFHESKTSFGHRQKQTYIGLHQRYKLAYPTLHLVDGQPFVAESHVIQPPALAIHAPPASGFAAPNSTGSVSYLKTPSHCYMAATFAIYLVVSWVANLLSLDTELPFLYLCSSPKRTFLSSLAHRIYGYSLVWVKMGLLKILQRTGEEVGLFDQQFKEVKTELLKHPHLLLQIEKLSRRAIPTRITHVAVAIEVSDGLSCLYTSRTTCRWVVALFYGVVKLPNIIEMQNKIARSDKYMKQSVANGKIQQEALEIILLKIKIYRYRHTL
ncbi:oxoglutarate/iron-dependent dioxygenase [Artemisia annua]|uniref:Phospho-2-dehydro-3-deoxyheptonate aldolase n=1 Tax=Artemisia annua TaxID=35608 RepID=A0A2U1P3J4_ARTAN|nr:oxoglutarate/iron-dependent dioxygenase [Artemisia annua]